MASHIESTSFLADNDHVDSPDEIESHASKPPLATAYFKPSIKILTIIIVVLSLSIIAILAATYILIITGPFSKYTLEAKDAIRHLNTCLIITIIYSAATIFLQIPVSVSVAINFVVLVVIFVYSDKMFEDGRMTGGFCLPYTDECLKHAKVVKALLDVSANMGLLVGLLLVTVLLLRATALTGFRFWKGKGKGVGNSGSCNLTGRAPSVLPNEMPPRYHDDETPVAAVKPPANGEEANLIET